jgi:flagellar assembly protein FliH
MDMSALIRDARFSAAPLLLVKTQSNGLDGQHSRGAQLQDALHVGEQGTQGRNVNVQSSPPPMTHDEFEQSLGERLDAMRREAREQGLREGRERGYADARKEESAQLEAMAALVRGARDSLKHGIEGLSELGAEIVFEAVLKMVGQIGTDREGITAIIRQVIHGAKDRSRLFVRVRKADLEWIVTHRNDLLEGLDAGNVEFVADDRVTLGGCILETPVGNLDGRLETQLASLRDILLSTKLQSESDR